jgi:hypothetical protein
MTMDPALMQPIENFRSNLKRIRDLLSFDEYIQDFAIKTLERVRESQDKAKPPIDNPRHRVDSVITLLHNIRRNDSLSGYYRTMHNQSLVLLVSYFAAALRDSYRAAVALALEHQPPESFLGEELKLTVGDLLRTQDDPGIQIADLLIDKKDLSFQDMKSTGRAFKDLCGHEPEKDQDVNDIITALACRHAIVHTGEVATAKTVRQIHSASPRTLKDKIAEGDAIAFEPVEVYQVAGAMERYLVSLLDGVSARIVGAPNLEKRSF